MSRSSSLAERIAVQIGVLASETSWYYRDLERAALDAGHQCERLDFTRLVSRCQTTSQCISGLRSTGTVTPISQATSSGEGFRTPLRKHGPSTPVNVVPDRVFDVLIVRTMPPGSLEQVVFRMDLLSRLERAGTQVVNSPKSLECAVDKFLTTAKLQEAGLPVPDTVVCEHEDDAMAAFDQLGGDVVVKPLFGSEGRGIVRVSDPDLAHRTFRTLMRLDSVLYLQKFIDHAGFDVRVLVLNNSVIGGMKRYSAKDFRTNVSREGIAQVHSPTSQEADYAVRAAACTGTFIAGIDLLYDRSGQCHVIEVNAVPGWQAFRRVTGIDVAAKLLAVLAQR